MNVLRGELAVLVLGILGVITIYDFFTGHTESAGQWLSMLAISGVLTGINALINSWRKSKGTG